MTCCSDPVVSFGPREAGHSWLLWARRVICGQEGGFWIRSLNPASSPVAPAHPSTVPLASPPLILARPS
jgi:hypothetical protein